jgi:hypothetical protein
MRLFRRFLVLAALMFWQGGFTFYAAVVVPVGQQVLGAPGDQGFITRQVTDYLNLSGGVALLALAWDAAANRERGWRCHLRWGCWVGMVVTLGVLCWLHVRLDGLLSPEAFRILDRQAFYPLHRLYLWISTLQWACALGFAGLTLWVWRDQDRAGVRR